MNQNLLYLIEEYMQRSEWITADIIMIINKDLSTILYILITWRGRIAMKSDQGKVID